MKNCLFEDNIKKTNPEFIPLAEKMRPITIGDLLGQGDLIGTDKLLSQMIENDNYISFILWGPPGSGKTSIVNVIKHSTKKKFVSFSAVLSGIKDIKEIMKEASYNLHQNNEQTILFIDEIHRFNKAQQDAFLPYVENGSIILIGATTENPSFEIINALLSRCQILTTQKIDSKQIKLILIKALKKEKKNIPDEVLDYISNLAGGDARSALNMLEILFNQNIENNITVEEVASLLNKSGFMYDKNGEEHYNLISALHKSIRGSDPDASIYWLARMIEAGEDPKYIVRRLIRLASEDIGLADPNALVQAVAAKDAVLFVGMPESNTILTQLVVYLATAPKSNATEVAYIAAKKDAHQTQAYEVPMYIRNAPTKLMKEKGYGKGYKYSHDFKYHYSYQKYFPKQMREKKYYEPSNFGFEKEIEKRLKWWEKLKKKDLE